MYAQDSKTVDINDFIGSPTPVCLTFDIFDHEVPNCKKTESSMNNETARDSTELTGKTWY